MNDVDDKRPGVVLRDQHATDVRHADGSGHPRPGTSLDLAESDVQQAADTVRGWNTRGRFESIDPLRDRPTPTGEPIMFDSFTRRVIDQIDAYEPDRHVDLGGAPRRSRWARMTGATLDKITDGLWWLASSRIGGGTFWQIVGVASLFAALMIVGWLFAGVLVTFMK